MMLRQFLIPIFCLLLLQVAVPAAAEFYQYIDDKGITHFTDNVSTIPPQYQSQVKSHHEIISLPANDASADVPMVENDTIDSMDSGVTDDTAYDFEWDDDETVENTADTTEKDTRSAERKRLVSERKILTEKKDALAQKFEVLQAEKAKIEKSKGDMTDQENVARYNERVREMNEKIKQYKNEEDQFKEELAKYNQSISDLNKQNH